MEINAPARTNDRLLTYPCFDRQIGNKFNLPYKVDCKLFLLLSKDAFNPYMPTRPNLLFDDDNPPFHPSSGPNDDDDDDVLPSYQY